MTDYRFQPANKSDLSSIADLLTSADLPLAGVEHHIDGFLLAFKNGSITGCAALERYEAAALLRSVAVVESERSTGLGQELVRRLLDQAYTDGFKDIVLLTTTASRFFPRFGFSEISRTEAPTAVQASAEFQGACPDTAIVMQLVLNKPPIFVRRATEADLPAITEIYNQGISDRATFETRLRVVDDQREWLANHSASHPVIVAIEQGKVVGWAALSTFNQREAYRFVADLSIYVERERRGSGIGSALMADLIERGRALEYHKLTLTAFPHLSAALRLYERFGFRVVGDYKEQGLLDGQWTDTRIMELIL